MGNGKFLQFLTLLLCLCFGYFTYKAYSDVQQVKEENAILHEALDSLLVGSTMTSPDAESGVNVKSRLIKLVLLPLWYGNKDIIRDTLS